MSAICHELPAGQPVRAVAIVLHGLNLKPARMDGWCRMLHGFGVAVVRVPLHGHAGDRGHMREVSATRWRDEFQQTVTFARAEADRLGVPLHFVGYSLGGLVCLDWMSRQPEGATVFDTLVLAAPALSVPRYSETAIRLLSAFGPDFMIPSRSPRDYRANRGSTVAAYQALFALKRALEQSGYRNANRPTLVLIDPRDELVDSRDIARLIQHHQLDRWTLTTIDNRVARRTFGLRHLLVDEEAVGAELWALLGTLVARHLNLDVVPEFSSDPRVDRRDLASLHDRPID